MDELKEKRRQARVGSLLQRAVGDTLTRDFSDPRLLGVVISVTRVEVASDLRSARVWFSLLAASPAQQRTAWRALEAGRGRIQTAVAGRVALRWAPELHFKLDESLKKAAEMTRILREIAAEQQGRSLDDVLADEFPEPSDGELADGESELRDSELRDSELRDSEHSRRDSSTSGGPLVP